MRQFLLAVLIIITLTLQVFADNNKKVDPPNAHSLGIGINTFSAYNEFVAGKTFSNVTVGFNARLKFGPNFGMILNVLACDPVYYYEDPPGSGTFGSTGTWENIQSAGLETDYLFKQSTYIVYSDLALFIPVSIFQPYVAFGPAFDFSFIGCGYKLNTDGFKNWYDRTYGEDKIHMLGWNVKAGLDVFIGSVSLGIELNFLVYDFESFVQSVKEDPGSLIRNSQVGITALIWIF